MGLPICAIRIIVRFGLPNVHGALAGEVEVCAEVGQGIRQREQGRGAVRLRRSAGQAQNGRTLTWPPTFWRITGHPTYRVP